MFNKFALVITGLMLTVSSVGCCCHGGGYGANYGMNRCAPCNNGCAPAGGGAFYPQTGQVYQGDLSQTAYAPGGYTQSAAIMPGAIQGAPIYNTAFVPVNGLPTF